MKNAYNYHHYNKIWYFFLHFFFSTFALSFQFFFHCYWCYDWKREFILLLSKVRVKLFALNPVIIDKYNIHLDFCIKYFIWCSMHINLCVANAFRVDFDIIINKQINIAIEVKVHSNTKKTDDFKLEHIPFPFSASQNFMKS